MPICKLNLEQKTELAKKYHFENRRSVELGKEYKLSPTTVLSYIREIGFKIKEANYGRKRKYDFDESFFEKINTEEKAYFLGLLYADGCVTNDNTMVISLQEGDLSILERMKKEMKFEGPIYYTESRGPRFSKAFNKIYNSKPMYAMAITSKKLGKDLIKLGCIPRKSLKLKFPNKKQVPKRFIRHFIRGYFDGDGYVCICKYKNKSQIRAGITSTKIFLRKIKIILKSIGIKASLKQEKAMLRSGNNITASIYPTSSVGVIKFLDWFYKDAKVYLNRKYDRYISIKKEYKYLYEGR